MRELQNGMYIVKRRRINWRRFFLFRYFTGRAIALLGLLMLLIIMMMFASKAIAATNDEPLRVKTISSVCIESGDTLWSIAQKYYTDDCKSIQQYIEEIKQSNGLRSDKIHAGAYIIVPHYVEP